MAYDTDFYRWTAETASLLRERRFSEVELEAVIEEIESLGRRPSLRAQLTGELVAKAYRDAARIVAVEYDLVPPGDCPYTVCSVLEGPLERSHSGGHMQHQGQKR